MSDDTSAEECGDYLMESDWEEGFTCSLPVGHPQPHRAEGGINEINIGTDEHGHEYTWTYEWSYKEDLRG